MQNSIFFRIMNFSSRMKPCWVRGLEMHDTWTKEEAWMMPDDVKMCLCLCVMHMNQLRWCKNVDERTEKKWFVGEKWTTEMSLQKKLWREVCQWCWMDGYINEFIKLWIVLRGFWRFYCKNRFYDALKQLNLKQKLTNHHQNFANFDQNLINSDRNLINFH